MASQAAPAELGTRKISTLLKQYAIPGIIAMTASSIYNIVDSIYIGHIPGVGSLAISGLAVSFPLMNLSTALGTLVGVGASTMISILLGKKNYDMANKVLANEVTLNTLFGIAFAVVTLLLLDPILLFFGASENTLPFARDYMTVILLGNAVTHLYFGLNNVIRASGNPRMAMGLTLFTVFSNALLDPLFIFVFHMGIQGAAIATVLCQLVALGWTMHYFTDRNRLLHLPKRIFALDWGIARESLAIGMGPFLMNAAACIVTLFINQQLLKYGGDLAIGGYGIVNRISFLFVMVTMGINQGMQPIAGYNFGARQYRRVREVYLLAAGCATAVLLGGFAVCEFLPSLAAGAFTSDPALKGIAIRGLRVVNAAFPIIGFQMVGTNLFQCLGMVKKSIFLSLTRQLIYLVPMVYLLPLWWGLDGIWASYPASDILAAVTTAILLIPLLKKLGRLQDGQPGDSLGGMV